MSCQLLCPEGVGGGRRKGRRKGRGGKERRWEGKGERGRGGRREDGKEKGAEGSRKEEGEEKEEEKGGERVGGRKRVKRKGTERRSERGRQGCRKIWREEEGKIKCVLRRKYSYLDTAELSIVFSHRDNSGMHLRKQPRSHRLVRPPWLMTC